MCERVVRGGARRGIPGIVLIAGLWGWTGYMPLVAHRLGKIATVDEPRSRRLTRAAMGGWAGARYREDVGVAHPEGAPPRLVHVPGGEPFIEEGGGRPSLR
jgi:hypothetical protein